MKKINDINIQDTIDKVRQHLEQDKNISATTASLFELLILIITLLANRIGLNSSNSSKPPSSDNKKLNTKTKNASEKKPGGQPGRIGTKLDLINDPEEVIYIPIDKSTLPKGNYQITGFEKRQVFDIKIQRWVTEYQAEVATDDDGNQFVAMFPSGVTQQTQYGNHLKAHAVYLSQFQLLPYERVKDYFHNQAGIPISVGSLYNFNELAYQKLDDYEVHAKQQLIESRVVHADETGININGKKSWLHCACNFQWTYLYPHANRGKAAIDEAGVLPEFKGALCHDHWKSYYLYPNIQQHLLCNAHHLRELTRAYEQDHQQWAYDMHVLLFSLNMDVESHKGKLPDRQFHIYIKRYLDILDQGEEACPPNIRDPNDKAKGKLSQSKSRNLLERLRRHDDEVLKFATDKDYSFTNNLAENDIRMTKVQQKISGCFRSKEGAKNFCRIRGYLSSCQKQGKSISDALEAVFSGDPLEFIKRK